MKDTGRKIMLAALRLFAREGYEAASLSRIAEQVGITKGALYRHFADKRDIFESILREMERRDTEQAQENELPVEQAEMTPEAYETPSLDQIASFSREMFRYWTRDEFAASFRRMLTLEQFRNAEMAGLYQQYLASGPMEYTRDLFAAQGIPRAEQEAAAFYGAMFLLYSAYDAAEDGESVIRLADETIDGMTARLKNIREG